MQPDEFGLAVGAGLGLSVGFGVGASVPMSAYGFVLFMQKI